MATKKITLNELRSLVKQIIKEDVNQQFYQGEQHVVKINKCDNPMYWYKNYINQEFNVVADDSRTKWEDGKEKWKVIPDKRTGGGVSYISKEDTKVIK